ncbi:MAG: MFS transporter [Bacteroidia bacterium]|nr:MFS transporter [Bacteroidia bacterium]
MTKTKILNAAVIVSALGYFVDVFDLFLFGVVRVKSLTALGVSGQELVDAGITIQNWQMAGLLIGGIASGILGDKVGRVRALYASITLYSLANILNGLVWNVETYALCRFIAGIGLAGELGSGITLVAESLPTGKRGLGTTIVAGFGTMGAVAAGLIDYVITDWQVTYFFGGGLGLLLLALRLSVSESPIFSKTAENTAVKRGNFFSLFNSKDKRSRLFKSTFLSATTWFNTGILTFFAPEFGIAKGISEPISAATAIIWFQIGMVLGDFGSGLLSQYLKSRIRAIQIFLTLQLILIPVYLFAPLETSAQMYMVILALGFSGGFWAVFITNASEQFGTNLRATATSTIPGFVRGLFIPIGFAFKYFKAPEQLGSPIIAAAIVGGVCLLLAFWSSFGLEDTFHKDLDFLEKD